MPNKVFDLLPGFSRFIQEHQLLAAGDQLLVGVSGGPDSICLLHLLSRYGQAYDLPAPVVAHLDHQLRGEVARADAAFVQSLAQAWGLRAIVESQDVAQLALEQQLSIEAAGRQARYLFFWRAARSVGANKVAVGHQADDQAETVLMHFLRGTGLKGLRGMLPSLSLADLPLPPAQTVELRPDSAPRLIRPMLELTRQEIERYCQIHRLPTRQDATNQQTDYFRNRLRHEVLPFLRNYNPNLDQMLSRTAKLIAAEVEVVEQQLDRVWSGLLRAESPQRLEFHRSTWLALPLALKRAVLRRAVEQLQGDALDLGFEHIEAALEVIAGGRVRARVTLPGGLLIQLAYDTFSLEQAHAQRVQPPETPWLDERERVPLTIPGQTLLPHDDWQLVAELLPRERVPNQSLTQAQGWEAYLDAASLGPESYLRPRQAGDRFQPFGMSGLKKVKAFMIDQKIPAAQRNRIPILVSGPQILWVCGYRLAEPARVGPESRQIVHFKFSKVG